MEQSKFNWDLLFIILKEWANLSKENEQLKQEIERLKYGKD